MPDISDQELADLKAAKESAAKLEAKNKELLEEKKKIQEQKELSDKAAKEAEEKRLKDAGDYKTLADQLAAEKAEREKSDKEKNERLTKGAKLTKVQEELTKIGLDAKAVSHALKLINLDDVKYDDATSIVLGADAAAAKLKLELPHLFVKADPEKIPGGDGGNGNAPAEMSLEWYNSLSEADKKKNYKAFMKSQGVDVR